MKRPNFTLEEEYWICDVINEWYLAWKNRMVEDGQVHMLGIAKEQLKRMLCGEKVTFINDVNNL